jgi:phage-related protein
MADGSLLFDTELDTSGLKAGLSGIGGVAKAGLGVAAAGFAAVTTAAVATTGAIMDGVSAAADYGDTIDKMSQKMGLSTDAYQEWDFVMQHCGTSIEALKPSMKTLAMAAEKGSDAFAQLGISEEQIATMSQEELFNATIAGLQGVTDETQRTALAAELLGRGATELGPLMNMTAEETEAMRQQVHDLGGVMSNDAVKAAAAYKDSLQNMQTAISGLKNKLAGDLLPSVTTVMDGLTLLFSGGDTDEAMEMIGEGIDQLCEKLEELIPQVMEIGGQILMKLAEAIIENLPTLIDSGMSIINELIAGIIEALPQLLEAGMQIITGLVDATLQNLPMLVQVALQMLLTLAQGITDQLPTLIPAIIDVVLQVVNTLIENLPMLIEGAIQLFLGIVTGLIQALPQIIAALPTLIDSIINALIDSIPLLIECGVELFLALIENLPEIIVAIVKAAPQIVQALVRGFLELGVRLKETGSKLMKKLKEGLTSMLSNLVSAAKDLGKNIVDGIWNGISAGWDWLKEKVGGLATGLFDAAKSALGISSPSKKFRYLGEMCVAGFDDGIEDLMDGGSLGAAINNTLGTVAANVGIGEGTLGTSQTFNFYDTQTSPDAIRRKVANTMTFGLAGGI